MHANRHTRGQRWLAWVMAVVLCLGLLPGAALAAEETTYEQVTSADQFTSGEYYMVTDTGYAPGVLDGTWVSAVEVTDGSVPNAIWTLTVTGNEVKLQDQNGKYIAPKGGNNNGIQEGEYSWKWSFEGGKFVFAGQGEDTVVLASNKSSQNQFRAYKTTTVEGNSNGYPSEFTLYKVINGSQPGEGGDTTVAAPQADPQAEAVASGTEITLTCATADAQIYYTLDGSDPTTESMQYSDSNKPKIEGTAGAEITLKAIAVLGENQSAVQTLTYTIKEVEYVYQQITELDELLAGGNFVFAVEIAEGKYRAIGSEFNYQDYLEDVEATVEDGVLTFGEDMQIFTVSAINGQDNKVSLSSEGKYLYSGQYQPTLSWSTTQYGWLASASESENGTFRLSSPSNANRYLSWRGDPYGKFGANVLSSSNVDTYIGDLLVFRQEEKTETNAPIADGDQVVIYAPAYNKALSSEKTGFYNVGTDITVSEGTVSGYGENDVWTVVDNGDNTYSFQQNGQNIGLGESYASMDLGAVNDDWKLIDLGNGLYNIQNTVRGNYMEWYAQYSNWSTYNSSSAATDDQFQLSFYKVTGETPEPEPEAPIKSGDTVVIYAPSNYMALSATVKNSYYPIGVEVAVEGDTLTGYGATEVWTVGGEDGSWTFSNGGKSLSMGNEHTSTYPGAGENETWVLESTETEGQYYVKNAGRSTYMFWDDEHDDWTTRNGEKTAVSFRVVEPPEEEPDVTGLEVRATPASGASVEAGDTIELTAAAGAEIYYTTDGTDPTENSTHYESPITLGSGEGQVPAPTDDKSLVIKAISVATNEEGEEEIGDVCTFTYQAPVDLDGYNLYFGQLHAHTNISDGAGSVTEAFQHASQVDNLDFLAVTDHSNSFDNESDSRVDLGADLTGISSEWAQGHAAAEEVTDEDFVGLYGFEMTWSDGFGHINTFNTPGFESRSNSEFGNKSGATEGYQNYYDKLVEVGSSLSQFNHPGTTFGDFQDFAFYDPQVDQRITLIEVGNGEGAIGSSGYFPSYEYYTRALDKGWHVAPTNNQDNHKGNWGDSNTARSVVLASGLTEEGIYDAIRNYRVYATEDNDLSILYALNGNAMGSILSKQENGVTLTAQITDPTDTADMKVEVIVNGGLVIGTQTVTGGSGTVTFHFDSNEYSYYYLRITQADQNIAVTAPVWTGESVNAGIAATECDTALVVKGEAVTLSSELYNNAGSGMTVQSVEFSVDGKTVYTADISTIGTNGFIPSGGTATVSFPYAFASAGKTTVDVAMTATIGGTEHTFTSVLQLTVTDESLVTRVLVDGTHYNDYVTGYYSGNMGNFTELAADMNAQVTVKQPGEQPGEQITADDLEGVSLLVISAPLKYDRDGLTANSGNRFSDEFIEAVKNYVQGGGTVIVCGLADYQDKNNNTDPDYTTYGQINKLLEDIGATMRVNDDELIDQDENGGQAYRLYFDDFNYDSTDAAVQAALAGLGGSDKVYSSYSGCSVRVGSGEAIVYGHDTTYSINSKNPAQGHDKPVQSYEDIYDPDKAVVQKGDVVSLATEAVGSGRVYLGGTVWMSDFEVKSDGSNGSDYGDASYANKTIISNILSGLLKEPEVSTIARVRENTTVGTVFTVEGTVTAGNVEPNAFYDTIYIQDATGGINIYPVATTDGTFQVGQKVRVTGSWDQYQGDTELRCISIEALGSELNPIQPTELDISDVDYANNGGLLAQVGGTVKSIVKEGDAISSVILTDGTKDFRLLFNNYIGYSDESSPDITTFVEEGAEISAVGVIYMDPDGVCLRVRDLSEVQLVEDKPSEPEDPNEPDVPVNPNPSYAITVEQPDHGTVTVTPDRATQGATVTITTTPDQGYQVNAVTVTDRFGDAVRVTENSDGTYTFTMPNGQVTVTATFVQVEEPAPTEPFIDVAEGDWFYDAVVYAYQNELMDGVGGNRFAPNSETTRAQLVTILYRLEGQPAVSGDLPFADVEAGTWYTNAVGWAAQNGIVNGVGDDTFAPGNDLTREQLVTILYRYAESKGYDVSASADLAGYPDGEEIQAYAREAMAWAVAENIIQGMEDDTLKPAGNASRAQIATILMRFCEGVAG